jgi:hypothetical protein
MRPNNARAVLAAGCLLGGMEDLCQTAYEVCRESISVDTIGSWLEFLETIPSPASPVDGSSPPHVSIPQRHTVFGVYAQRIRDDVFHFLVVTLPQVLDVQGSLENTSDTSGRDILLQIFSRVPFEVSQLDPIFLGLTTYERMSTIRCLRPPLNHQPFRSVNLHFCPMTCLS